MKKHGCFWILLFLLTTTSAHAFQLSSILTGAGAYGLGTRTNIKTNSNFWSSDDYGYGGGFMFLFGLIGPLGFEVDYVMGVQKVQTNVPAGDRIVHLGLRSSYFQVPLLFTIRLFPALSLGLGAYYHSYVSRNVSAYYANSPDTRISSDFPLPRSHWGYLASLRLRFPASTTFGLFLEGRYAYGMSNRSRDQEPQAMVGINWTSAAFKR